MPEREGSLQIELISATRRHDRIPYVLKPELQSVIAEVTAGNPVLVLQNLGLSIIPKWHYAVVVGFDLNEGELILRSGDQKRHLISMKLFERTWQRSGYWAFVALPADRLPSTAEEIPYLQSVAALESTGRAQTAALAYRSAIKEWPQSLPAHMGLGNSLYATGDTHGARQAYQTAIRHHPDAAVAHNNLAHLLADEKNWAVAEVHARRAVLLGGPQLKTFQQTLERILKRTNIDTEAKAKAAK